MRQWMLWEDEWWGGKHSLMSKDEDDETISAGMKWSECLERVK